MLSLGLRGCGWFLATWRALPILVLVSGIGLAFRRRLSPSLHALLWTLIIARLLIPISMGNPLSLHGPIDSWFSADFEEPVNPGAANTNLRHSLLPNVDSPDSLEWTPYQPAVHRAAARDFTLPEFLYMAMLAIIVSVTAGLLFRNVFSHIRFAVRLRSCRKLDDRKLVDLMLHECDCLSVGRRPTLREVPSLGAPAVFGLMRQTICLPPHLIDTASEQELRWVIRHELAHIRRRDIPVMVTASIVSAFHWFNPIVWLVVSRLRAAMEAAADRLALQSVSQSDAAVYGELLLRFAEDSVAAKRSSTLGLISSASGIRLKQRVELLMRDRKPNGMSARFVSAGLVAAIAIAGLTDARETEQKVPEFHLVASDSIESQVQPLWLDPFNARESDGPTVVEEYDLASIFETMPESLTSSEKTPQEQLTTWLPLPASLKEKLHVEGQTLSADLTARQHQLLKQTLDDWKNGEPKQITIEARVIQTNIKTASSIDWAGQGIEALTVKGLGPALAARIGEPELAQLVRAVSAERKGNIVFAPKVTLFDGQMASITDQVRHPFVTGVDPKADGRLQPVVSIVDEGLSFVLTPKAGDDDSVSLAFEVRASSIGKVSYANLPIRTSENAAPQFTVQVPATEQYEVSSSVKLAAGESIVVAIPRVFSLEPGADAETTMIVTLTPRVIATQEPSVATASNQ
ncbi:MAG: M56 family metallopeptidase [Pirellulaceae bacterium]